MTEQGVGWARLTGDGPVTDQPCLLHGIVFLTGSSGSPVDVYDGVDAGAGRQVARLKNQANRSHGYFFPRPLRMDVGIYVVLDANVDEVTIVWEPR